jgi:phosphatidylglycerol:prolipoprotein diacylglycerol transferase
MSDVISFPGLGITVNPPRVAFELFGRGIYWYGIILATAFLLAAVYCIRRAPKFGITGDDLTDVLIFATPAAIICARAYYVVFEWRCTPAIHHPAVYLGWGRRHLRGHPRRAHRRPDRDHRQKNQLRAVLDISSLGLLIGQIRRAMGQLRQPRGLRHRHRPPWRMEIYDRIAGVRQPCIRPPVRIALERAGLCPAT